MRDVIEAILRYGKRGYHRGGRILFMDKKALRRARIQMGESYKQTETKLRKCYIVVSGDDQIITVAHRTGRLKF